MEELAKEKHVFQAALQWSAVLLNRTKERIKPLFELNRTNEMPTFSTTSTQKKIPAECWRAKEITCKRILVEKNVIVNQGVEKKFMTKPNHPNPPPPLRSQMDRPLGPVQTSNFSCAESNANEEEQ